VSSPDLPPELATRFEALREIGRGTFGVVVEARDRKLGRAVAIKLLRAELAGQARQRFASEASLLAQLRDPGVVDVYDHGETSGGPYLVMELLEGRSWRDAPPEDLVAATLEVAAALEAVHAAGVLHRDIKPDNLMRTRDGRVVLMDFGLARELDRETITRTGAMVGTAPYLAPELWRGRLAEPPSDWYALGATLYELLEGRPPYEIVALAAHGNGVELRPPEFPRSTPDAPASRLAVALLDPDPSRRPRGARGLRKILGRPTATGERARESGRAAGEVRPVPGGSRLRTLVVAALCFSLGYLFRGGQGPAPTRELPSSEEATWEETREPLERAIQALAAKHALPDGTFQLGRRDDAPGQHLDEVVREFADARFPVRFRRFLDALTRFLEAAPAEAADPYLAAKVVPLLDHLAGDRLLLSWYSFQPHAFGSEDPEVVSRGILDKDTLVRRKREMESLGREAQGRLEASLDRPEVAQVAARIPNAEESTLRLELCRQVMGHVRAASSSGEALERARGLILLGPSSGGDGGAYTCEDREELADLLREVSGRPGGDPGDRARVAADALFRSVQTWNACRQELTSEDLSTFEDLVTVLEESAEHAPGAILLEAESMLVFHHSGGFLIADHGPRYEASMRRLEALVEWLDTRLRGHPRGWKPGRPPTSASRW
jgi:hypothetical protein